MTASKPVPLHSPLGLLAELTHRCPLGCPYCSNPLALDRRDDELDTATWARVFREAAALGVLQVHLSGGEPAAVVLVDCVARLIPGALGSETSAVNESFSAGLLDFPHYTRPTEFRGMRVPDVLVSGNHREIARWRTEAALEKTERNRPDLLE